MYIQTPSPIFSKRFGSIIHAKTPFFERKKTRFFNFQQLSFAQTRIAILWTLIALLVSCKSQSIYVPPESWYENDRVIEAKAVQIVESVNEKSIQLPQTMRFRENCTLARKKAEERFAEHYPHKNQKILEKSERFDAKGGCTVRMLFEI